MAKHLRLVFGVVFGATFVPLGCGGAPEESVEPQATLVGRIQGTEFTLPTDGAAIWLDSGEIGALRLSEGTNGCGEPQGWSLLVQVNQSEPNEYEIGLGLTGEQGKGFLVEYRREDGTLDMPAKAIGWLTLSHVGETFAAGSLALTTDGGADFVAVYQAPLCRATALVNP